MALAPVPGRRGLVSLGLRDQDGEREAERKAQAHERRLVGVLHALAEGVALLVPPRDEESPWRVGLVNRGLESLLGVDESRALGAPLDELAALVAHEFAAPHEWLDFVASADERPEHEHRQIFDLAERNARTVEVGLRPVLDKTGLLQARLVVVSDITRHRTAERQLEADAAELDRSRSDLQSSYETLIGLHKELELRTEELSKLNAELERMDTTRTKLLGDLAHDLQTPLVSIRGYAQMILEGRLGRLTDEQRSGLETLLKNVERMGQLVRGLASVARPDASAERAGARGAVEARKALEEALSRHEGAARECGVRLEAQLEGPDRAVSAGPGELEQVLDNLLSNAIKFTPRGGRVTLTAGAGPEGYLGIAVRDTGVGIPGEEMDRIWDRHFRGREAGEVPGSGLGLSLVRETCRRAGARITCESAAGEGTIVRVLWPLVGPSGTVSANAAS
jgi:signal transduction histidine kinase